MNTYHQYIAEFYDSDKSSILHWELLDYSGVLNFIEKLGLTEFDAECIYECEYEELGAIVDKNILDTNCIDELMVRRCVWDDHLSYRSHTNRELLLMLQNKKPLSVFREFDGTEDDSPTHAAFQRYSSAGNYHRIDRVHFDDENTKVIFYVLEKQEWRVDAYFQTLGHKHGVSDLESSERKKGLLLGYTECQIDEYIGHIAAFRKKKGSFLEHYDSLPTHFSLREKV